MTRVVAGLLIRDGRLLLQQRPSDKPFPFLWETPGGKVEQHELEHLALARELFEELGITARNIGNSPVWTGLVTVGQEKVEMGFYVVGNWLGKLLPLERQGLGWFTFDEMLTLPLTPGNALIVPTIKDLLTT